jgi:predicted metalloendopeptidase
VRAFLRADRAARNTAQARLARVERIKTHDQFMAALRELHAHGVNAFFRFSGEPDINERSRYRGEILQASLGLRRLAYADTGAAADAERSKYREHVSRMFALAGATPAQADDANGSARLRALFVVGIGVPLIENSVSNSN